MNLKEFLKTHQHTFVLTVGYMVVGTLAFGLGRFTSPKISTQQAQIQQAISVPNNYNPNETAVQTALPTAKAECAGKIKGSSSLIYHVPGGSFYNRTTNPIRCFATEAEAKTAGFRKSAR